MKLLAKIQLYSWIFLFLVMGLSINLVIDIETAIILRESKKYLLYVFLGISFFLIISTKFKGIRKKYVFLFALFPFYYLIVSILHKNNFVFNVIGLYLLWWYYVSMISPNFLGNRLRIKEFFLKLKGIVIIIVIFGVYAFFNELGYFQQTRLSFGYENPNYFAQYLLIGIISVIYVKSKITKRDYLFIILMSGLIFLTVSRNVYIYILAALFWYWLYKFELRNIVKLLVFFIAILLVLLSDFNYSDINSVSHGRLLTWLYQLDQLTQQGEMSIIFGTNEFIGHHENVISYSRFSDSGGEPGKIRSDNIFLEIFLESGIIGLILFIVPFFYLWKDYSNMKNRDRQVNESLLIGAICQGMFVTNFVSFFAPVSLLLPLILMKNKK